jgi:transposase
VIREALAETASVWNPANEAAVPGGGGEPSLSGDEAPPLAEQRHDEAVLPTSSNSGERASTAASRQRWTLRRLVCWLRQTFGKVCCRETLRRALHRLGFSWKKGKKLLSKASPAARQAFVERLQDLLTDATWNKHLLVYVDEAHIHQDADLGHLWSLRGERAWVGSTSPGLKAKATFYGLYAYNEGQAHIWPQERANGEITVEVLKRLRDVYPDENLVVVWDGASWHTSHLVRDAAAELRITLVQLPAYSPDFMPVEALWRWLREEVTYNRCHATLDELLNTVADFERRINEDPCAVADRLWAKDTLDPEQEKLRISE